MNKVIAYIVLFISLLAATAGASSWGQVAQQPGAWEQVKSSDTLAMSKDNGGVGSGGGIAPMMGCTGKYETRCGYETKLNSVCGWVSAACATTVFVCNSPLVLSPAGVWVCAGGQAVCVVGTIWSCRNVTETNYVCRQVCVG